jgi:hypothetical protein
MYDGNDGGEAVGKVDGSITELNYCALGQDDVEWINLGSSDQCIYRRQENLAIARIYTCPCM